MKKFISVIHMVIKTEMWASYKVRPSTVRSAQEKVGVVHELLH